MCSLRLFFYVQFTQSMLRGGDVFTACLHAVEMNKLQNFYKKITYRKLPSLRQTTVLRSSLQSIYIQIIFVYNVYKSLHFTGKCKLL